MSKLAWKDINWTLVQKRISRQQRRVYKASKEKNKIKVQAIQNKMLLSLDTKLLAVREATTKKKGYNNIRLSRIIGISHEQKVKLAYSLKLHGDLRLIRHNFIQKYKKRKLTNIQIIEDRAKQMIVKLILEPEWEAIFEPNSYGFRPGRSYCDSIATLSYILKKKYQYILNISLKKCFGKIDNEKLLKKLTTFSLFENQINRWLKVNMMSKDLSKSTQVFQLIENTFQFHIISSLLTNIILHGLENYIKNSYVNLWYLTLDKNSRIVRRKKKLTLDFQDINMILL